MLQGNWLSQICTELENETGVRISDYARQLILQTAVAAQYDPHPAWGRSRLVEERLTRGFVEGLIEQELRALIASGTIHGGVITYFHVLHWFHTSDRLLSWPVSKD